MPDLRHRAQPLRLPAGRPRARLHPPARSPPGKTKDEIKDELVAQYGTQVLAEPPKSGFDLTAWLVPGAAILIAAIAIALGLRRWRRAARGGGGSRRRAAARRSTPPTPSDSTPIWRATTSELPGPRGRLRWHTFRRPHVPLIE